MSNYVEYNDSIIFHPGYYINEMIEEDIISHSELAAIFDIPMYELDLLLNGEKKLSYEQIAALSKVSGASIDYWYNVQDEYYSSLGKINY